MINPIQYSSNDFQSVLNDINADALLIDKPEWFKRLIAGIRDSSNIVENAVALQSFLRTAFTREAVYDLCALIDYQIPSYTTSQGYAIFFLDAAAVSFPITFTAAELKAVSQGSIAVSTKQFEARTSETVSAISETFTAVYTTNLLTVARVYITGEKVRVSTTGTLPDPLAIDTDYFVIYVSDTTIKLAETVVKAFLNDCIDLTNNGTPTNTIKLYSFSKLCYQQETKSTVVIGTSNGTDQWQIYYLPDAYILPTTLSIVINSVTWTQVTTFVNSISTDKHYKIIRLSNQYLKIMFGDGTYGAIPGAFSVYASYAVGGGITSNISVQNKIIAYAGGNVYINGVTNSLLFTGGAEEQSLEKSKIVAPMLLKARSRDITTDDGKYLAEAYSGVLKAKIIKNVYGLFSQQVVIVPSGGGYPTAGLKTALAAYLQALTILESVYTLVVDPVYVPISITATVKITATADWTTTKAYVVLAFRLLFSEVNQEIIDLYYDSGIASAITYINAKWATSFSTTDYVSISKIIENLTASEFGKDFQSSDVAGYIDSIVDGVDYIIIASPSFPITILDTEIVQDNINPALITQI